MLPFAYVCTHKTTVKSTNRSFNFDSLHRKSPLYSVTLDAGPLQWRGEVSIRGSPPGDACFWVVRRLQVLGCSHSCPTSLTYAFCFSLSTQRLYLSDHVCLSVVRTGCPLCETAPDGWMDVSVLGRTGIIQWTDRGSVFCSAFFFCLEFILRFAVSGIVAFSGGNVQHLFLRLWSPAMCLVWKIPGGRCTAGSSLEGQDICNW